MGLVKIDESILTAIAGAIRSKLGVATTYKPNQMASAIGTIEEVNSSKNGQVVVNGHLANQTSKSITENGTHDTTTNNSVTVNVEQSFVAEDEGKVVSNGALVSQTSKNISANGTVDTTTNNEVVVAVPNSYSAGDEGKVVSNGALVAQSSQNITQNGTYDTTLKNEVVVNVSGGGGGSIIYSTSLPTSADGNDNDTFVVYHSGIEVTVTVTGGYNGGAVVKVYVDNTQVFTATAADTYNRNYDTTQADVSTDIGTISIQITPPASTTGELYITVTGPNNAITCNPPKQGNNTSYGYGNYTDTDYLSGTGSARIADALYIKQSGTWKGVGDIV